MASDGKGGASANVFGPEGSSNCNKFSPWTGDSLRFAVHQISEILRLLGINCKYILQTYNAALNGNNHSLGAIAYIQLIQNPIDMGFNSAFTDTQSICNIGITHPLSQ